MRCLYCFEENCKNQCEVFTKNCLTCKKEYRQCYMDYGNCEACELNYIKQEDEIALSWLKQNEWRLLMESTIVAREKSTHECPVQYFDFSKVEKHPDADRLGVMKIENTDYTYVLNLEDWSGYNGYVAWIPPDSLVPVNSEQFVFLAKEGKYNADSNKGAGYAKIKAKKIRGVVSYGLLVKVDENIKNAANYLGIVHYDPPIVENNGKNASMGGDVVSAPPGVYPKYDVDAFMEYGRKVFVENESVIVTEKLHGANARYVAIDNSKLSKKHENFEKPGYTMYCGSREQFKKEFSQPPKLDFEELKLRIGDEAKAKEVYDKAVNGFKPKKNLWWVAFDNTPGILKFCESNLGYMLYGEVYGQVQKEFGYDANGSVLFRAFDILKPDGKWMDADEFFDVCDKFGVPTVPILHKDYKFDADELIRMASGESLIGKHIREGIVVKPVKERWDSKLGRVNLKIVSPEYLAL